MKTAETITSEKLENILGNNPNAEIEIGKNSYAFLDNFGVMFFRNDGEDKDKTELIKALANLSVLNLSTKEV